MGKNGTFVGLDYKIGPVVGIGLFGGTGPVLSLTYLYIYLSTLNLKVCIKTIKPELEVRIDQSVPRVTLSDHSVEPHDGRQ